MLNNKQKNIFTLLTLALPIITSAQCAMCRASLESEGNATKAEALNDGIVYLMIVPYLLVGVVAYIVYSMFYKKKNTSETIN
jgi:amino acid permease